MIDKRIVKVSHPGWCWTLLATLLTIIFLVLPDFLLGPMHGQLLQLYDPEGWISVIVVGVCLTHIASQSVRLAAISFVAINQVIWLGCYAYFGDILRPEHLMLLVFEVDDTGKSVLAELPRLLPPNLIVLGCGLLVYFTHTSSMVGNRVVRLRGGGVALIVAFLFAAALWNFGGDRVVKFAGSKSPSVTATYHTLVTAVRFSIKTPAGPLSPSERQNFTLLERSSEPVTVAIIMGESINPTRLSMFGAPYDTTPILKSWLRQPPAGLSISARFGFSMGVSTLASVPSLIRVASAPVGALQNGVNFFQIAQKSEMKSSFLSAQTGHFLNTAGGAPGASLVETVDNNKSRYAKVGDDYLLDYLKQIADDSAPRQFVFMHQRVNHAPYTDSCRPVAEQVKVFRLASRPDAKDQVQVDYDNGLRCWDRNIARYVEVILKRPGAIYIFVTADHNEFMGEGGLRGHMHSKLENALVPFVLLTNRPQSPVQELFENMPAPSFFHLSRAIARAMDADLEVPSSLGNRFYVNRTLPFGLAGFMEARQTGDWRFAVRMFDASGKQAEGTLVDLHQIAAREMFAQAVIPIRRPRVLPSYLSLQSAP